MQFNCAAQNISSAFNGQNEIISQNEINNLTEALEMMIISVLAYDTYENKNINILEYSNPYS